MRLALVLILTLGVPLAFADEATLPNGRRVQGTLTFTEGRLRFPGVDFSSARSVRFAEPEPPPMPAGGLRTVHLADGQHFTAELLDLNDKQLRVRTAWAKDLAIPRQAVVAVTQLPDVVTTLEEDFEGDLKAWKVTGAVTAVDREATSGGRVLSLDAAEQVASYTLPVPLESGKVSVNVRLNGPVRGVRYVAETEFEGGKSVRVILDATASAETPITEGTSGRSVLTAGWHRLAIEFGRSTLVATVDNDVLWHTRRHGPGGALRRVRFTAIATEGAVRGSVAFDDLAISRNVEPLRRSGGDPTQDEVWLLSGDQVLGEVASVDRKAIELKGKFGKRSLGWDNVRGVFLMRAITEPVTSDGEHVRLWLQAEPGAEADELAGVVTALDEKHLTLRHPVLGEHAIDRRRLRRIQGLFHGQRVEVDNRRYLLGEGGRTEVEWKVPLDAEPATARLVLWVGGMGAEPRRAEGRVEVRVNGNAVDAINHHAEGASAEPRRLAIDVPRGALKKGANKLELRLTPRRDSERFDRCEVANVALELPR